MLPDVFRLFNEIGAFGNPFRQPAQRTDLESCLLLFVSFGFRPVEVELFEPSFFGSSAMLSCCYIGNGYGIGVGFCLPFCLSRR